MSDKNIARDYLTAYLPSFVADKLDFATLEQIAETYISKELQKTMSDIVYTCQRKDKGSLKVCLLIEHKSFFVDPGIEA